MMDKGKLMHQTLSGLKSVLKLTPMLLDGCLAVHHFNAGMSDAIRIAENAGIDLTPWLDDLHRHLPIRYSRTKPSITDDRGDWGIENSFWGTTSARFGYVISRWDTLMQSPHAQVFCSTLLRRQAVSHLSMTSEQWEEWLLLCRRLIAVLSEPSSGRGVVTATAHVRVEDGFRPETISWDARGHVNEATVKVFTDLLRITTDLAFLPDTPQVYRYATALFALLRSCNVYLGVGLKLRNLGREYLSPLQIQTDWACRRRPEQSDMCIRILCLAKNATTFGYHWYQDRNRKLPGKQYGEDVVSLFDMRIESLETLQFADGTIRSGFQGTQQDFSTRLDQILSVVRADEQGQLDAWQQLYTLACLKTYFKDFWTIQTSGTQWLAQITL
jgi:hypothetical protein